ncbi:M15 family metallopeptidase [Sphingomonas beigongshangi]|uniref:M15 family metallopeptidase n=1 Tax=Sphingomonas beigongshangi TaxID=2782540 RepID=UPI00193BF4C3|nr:M15 family metallopeptidase [Sphingomonas beigongshangi]
MRAFLPSLLLCGQLLQATPAAADICPAARASMSDPGRSFGHLAYGDAPPDELVPAPPGFGLGRCLVRRDMLPDLGRLVAAAAGDPAVGGTLRGLSCHRSIVSQAEVFCRGGTTSAADRAISVAPPGHSEHATGYAVDFAVRPANGCRDAEACMAATPAARWLLRNAPHYGFELSFPGGNRQQVKWEPWHWRWVGATASAPGAARARFVFAKARDQFPADPAVDATVTIASVVPVAFVALPAWVAPAAKASKKGKRGL